MTMETLNKSTSRKNKGAAENNRCEVREIVREAQDLGNGAYVITDRADNRIYVDTVRGLTGLLVPVRDTVGNTKVDIKWYEDGTTSSKSNGYVYTPIVVRDTKGKLSTTLYGTHSLVCMLADTAGYDALDSEGKTPICNHMRNKSWENNAKLLEWTTQGGNIRHGKIVSSLYHYFGDSYVHIEHNLSSTDFMVLDQPLSVKDIERYVEEIDNKYEFKCGNSEYINDEVLNAFVDWLVDNNIWRGSDVYE